MQKHFCLINGKNSCQFVPEREIKTFMSEVVSTALIRQGMQRRFKLWFWRGKNGTEHDEDKALVTCTHTGAAGIWVVRAVEGQWPLKGAQVCLVVPLKPVRPHQGTAWKWNLRLSFMFILFHLSLIKKKVNKSKMYSNADVMDGC